MTDLHQVVELLYLTQYFSSRWVLGLELGWSPSFKLATSLGHCWSHSWLAIPRLFVTFRWMISYDDCVLPTYDPNNWVDISMGARVSMARYLSWQMPYVDKTGFLDMICYKLDSVQNILYGNVFVGRRNRRSSFLTFNLQIHFNPLTQHCNCLQNNEGK